MPRVFSAVDVPADVRETLAELQADLDDGFNPVAPAQFHATLQFFEDIDEDEIEQVVAAMEAVELDPFQVVVQGVGAFPSLEYIAVVWAGLQADELFALYEQAADHAVPDDDDHDFHPHVTLLRVNSISPGRKEALQERIRVLQDTDFGTFTVDHITLYESRLGQDGPEYVELHETAL